VIEVRSGQYPAWVTWSGHYPEAIRDDEGAIKAFLDNLRTRHDPARLQFRLVRRAAVIIDGVLAEQSEDGTLSR
jgi:hypothetical protein